MRGYQLKLSGMVQFSELLGLKAGLQIIQRGEGLELAGTEITSYKGNTKTTYLVIPILATVSHSFGDILVFGQVGPYLGIGLSAKQVSLDPNKNKMKIPFSEYGRTRFDFGLGIGVGAGYPLGPGKLTFDLMYDIGFLDISYQPKEIKTGNYKATCNRTFEISIGYVIKIGK